MPESRLPPVQSLVGLARSNGIDVRTTLLRVVVDQFVLHPRHPAEEVTRFGELVLNLLDRAGEADRAIVAAKLADHPQTPLAVARRLAADTARVALPILARSTTLSDDDLFLAVRSGDADKALAVALREDIGIAALVALEDMDDARIRAALASRARRLGPPPTIQQRAALFLDSGTSGREAIIAALALETRPSLPPPDGPDPMQGRAIERAALTRRPDALAEALVLHLGLPAAIASRIASDPGGEPLVVLARALDLGVEAATRILIFTLGEAGAGAGALQQLRELYDAVPRPVAMALAGGWQAHQPAMDKPRTGRHQPATASDSSDHVGARRAASPAARTARRPGDPVAVPGRSRRET
ncbi:DUF2336 domain-containing protein [Phreatobacter sp.]|uniref:DUF2336 domain-containing protein n=1 Tax=Phreatobacter sp. TaxID=1966341 RepID=UPI003F70024D